MRGLTVVTIVFEYNYPDVDLENPKPGKGSVWLLAGDGSDDLGRRSGAGGWRRLLEAVDLDLAAAVCDGLKSFFEDNGITVVRQSIAD